MPTVASTIPRRLMARRCAMPYRTSFDRVTLARLAQIGQAAATVGVRTSITAILRHAVALYADRLTKLSPHNLPQEAIALRRAADGYSRQSPDVVTAQLLEAYAKFYHAAGLEIHAPEPLS